MTAMKYKLNCNCISQSITKSGLHDVVRHTVAKCEQYIRLHAPDNSKQKQFSLTQVIVHSRITMLSTAFYNIQQFSNLEVLSLSIVSRFIYANAKSLEMAKNLSHWVTSLRRWVTFMSPSCSVKRWPSPPPQINLALSLPPAKSSPVHSVNRRYYTRMRCRFGNYSCLHKLP